MQRIYSFMTVRHCYYLTLWYLVWDSLRIYNALYDNKCRITCNDKKENAFLTINIGNRWMNFWCEHMRTTSYCHASHIFMKPKPKQKQISKKSNQLDGSHSYAHLLLVCNLFLIIEISICVQFKYLNMTYLHWIARKVFACVEWVRNEFVWLTTTHHTRIFFFSLFLAVNLSFDCIWSNYRYIG